MARKMKTMDGNHAQEMHASTHLQMLQLYPITPSSVMAEATDEWATQGRTNIWTDSSGNRNAIRGRCKRYSTRFPAAQVL